MYNKFSENKLTSEQLKKIVGGKDQAYKCEFRDSSGTTIGEQNYTNLSSTAVAYSLASIYNDFAFGGNASYSCWPE